MNKTNGLFPCISDGYAHEQYNKLIKSDGQAVRILDSTNALLKWIMSGSVIASILISITQKVIMKIINHLRKGFRKMLLTWFKNF